MNIKTSSSGSMYILYLSYKLKVSVSFCLLSQRVPFPPCWSFSILLWRSPGGQIKLLKWAWHLWNLSISWFMFLIVRPRCISILVTMITMRIMQIQRQRDMFGILNFPELCIEFWLSRSNMSTHQWRSWRWPWRWHGWKDDQKDDKPDVTINAPNSINALWMPEGMRESLLVKKDAVQ